MRAALLWLILLATVAFEFAIADRGFEITDEGMALVAAAHPSDIRIAPTAFAWTTGPLYRIAGGDPAWFRRLGIALLALSGGVLGWGLTRLVREADAREAVPAGALGALTFLAPGLTMPSYNLVASCGASLAIGFFLWGLAREGFRSAALFLASGFALGLAGLSKPPGAAGIGLLLALSAIVGGWSWRPVFWVSGGAAALAQQLARQSAADFGTMIMDGLEFNRRVGDAYGLGNMASRYLAEWSHVLGLSLGLAVLPVAVLLLSRRWLGSRRTLIAGLSWAALAAGLVLMGAAGGGHRPATSGLSAAALVAVLIVAAVDALSAPARPLRVPLSMLFLAAPILALGGTNTPVGFSVLFFCAPWFLIPTVLGQGGKGSTAALVLGSLTAVWLAQGPFKSPYRRAPLSEMTASVQVGIGGSRLAVDQETARFLRSYRGAAVACGLRNETPVLAFSWMPGLVWAAGGSTPAITHFVNGFFPGARSANEFALSRVPLAEARRAFVLFTTAGESVHPTLVIGGRRFPDDGYRRCFEGEWPASHERVRLYAPPGVDPVTR